MFDDDFKKKYIGEWTFDAAYPREILDKMFDRGSISPEQYHEMLNELALNGRHILRDRHGNSALCGGPGVCKFCVRLYPGGNVNDQ